MSLVADKNYLHSFFCDQGEVGPRGEVGPPGPRGEKVDIIVK